MRSIQIPNTNLSVDVVKEISPNEVKSIVQNILNDDEKSANLRNDPAEIFSQIGMELKCNGECITDPSLIQKELSEASKTDFQDGEVASINMVIIAIGAVAYS